jgi:hypothetical protein
MLAGRETSSYSIPLGAKFKINSRLNYKAFESKSKFKVTRSNAFLPNKNL